jgi:hypothetical protein
MTTLDDKPGAIRDDSAVTVLGSWIQLIGVLTALVGGTRPHAASAAELCSPIRGE